MEEILARVAELFDLPGEVVAGLPHIELVGQRQLLIENHQGILSYSDSIIDVNTVGRVVRIRGERLELLAMTSEALRIGGTIADVEFLQ